MNWTFLKNFLCRRQLKYEAFGRTDTGKKRRSNEDSFAILQGANLFIVADGMGGHNAGEIASQNAVNFLADFLLESNLDRISGNQTAVRHALLSGFSHANEAIIEMAQENEAYSGMGCTMIACYISKDLLHFCHVGDVRGYMVKDNSINKLTTDHSYAAENDTTQSGNRHKIPKNIVTQAIGFPFKDGPGYNAVSYKSGDRAIICSDGLWGMLDDDIIMTITNSAQSPEVACDALIDQANAAGGRDNITAVSIFMT